MVKMDVESPHAMLQLYAREVVDEVRREAYPALCDQMPRHMRRTLSAIYRDC